MSQVVRYIIRGGVSVQDARAIAKQIGANYGFVYDGLQFKMEPNGFYVWLTYNYTVTDVVNFRKQLDETNSYGIYLVLFDHFGVVPVNTNNCRLIFNDNMLYQKTKETLVSMGFDFKKNALKPEPVKQIVEEPVKQKPVQQVVEESVQQESVQQEPVQQEPTKEQYDWSKHDMNLYNQIIGRQEYCFKTNKDYLVRSRTLDLVDCKIRTLLERSFDDVSGVQVTCRHKDMLLDCCKFFGYDCVEEKDGSFMLYL